MGGRRLVMKLNRPKLGVGSKTFIALSSVFWIPVTGLLALIFYLLQGYVYQEATDSITAYLKGAKSVYGERVTVLENLLDHVSSMPDVQKAFSARDKEIIQDYFLDISQRNSYVSILAAVDGKGRVIARRGDRSGDFLAAGDFLFSALLTGRAVSSTELVSKEFIVREDERLAELISDIAVVQFVVSPVRYGEKIGGAIVAGIVLTADPWVGNEVFHRFGIETALFAGKPPEHSFLHATASLPRSTWKTGQPLPEVVKRHMQLGRSFAGFADIEGAKNLVAFEPLRDGRDRVIGTIGVSIPATRYEGIVIRTLGKGMLLAALLGLLISVILTYFAKSDISRPLALLVKAMDDFGRGHIDTTVNLETGDEFEKLGTGFNDMAGGIRRREERLKKHYEVAKLLMSTLDLRELMEKVLNIAVLVTESQLGILYLLEGGGEKLIPHVKFGTKADLPGLAMGEGFPGRAAQDKNTLVISPSQDESDYRLELGFASSLPKEIAYIPLVYQDSILGVLVLGSSLNFREEEKELFDYLASQISIALDNAIMHHRIQELSITDALTGLFNRRHLNNRLEEEWSRSVRHKKPISIILADIDNFKSINDSYGHDKGDEVIRDIAVIFKDSVRKEDIPARYGGEEFVIVLPDMDIEDARKLAERIREKTKSKEYPWMERTVTLSVGVASFPDVDAENYEELIQVADKAMYKAKMSGKDKVVLFDEVY